MKPPIILMALTVGWSYGCSSGNGGHNWYSGPGHMQASVQQAIDAGAQCKPLPRPFDRGRDHIAVEVRPGTGHDQFWYGTSEWGHQVGGYLQLLSPWPFVAHAERYNLKCVLFCDPASNPLLPTPGVVVHEAGGHGNLVPSGIFDHPGKFRSCYPWWRLTADGFVEEPIGHHIVYGPHGEVLHECWNDDVQHERSEWQ